MIEQELRILTIVSHPIQYFAPLFREMERLGINHTVLYHHTAGHKAYFDQGFGQQIRWDTDLMTGYRSESLSHNSAPSRIQLSVIFALGRSQFDVLIIHGYSNLTNILAAIIGRLKGKVVLIRGDSNALATGRRGRLVQSVKKGILMLFHGALSIGIHNTRFYRSLGFHERNIHYAPLAVDNKSFERGPEAAAHRRQLREALSLDEADIVFVFVAKLLPHKRCGDVLEASKLLSKLGFKFSVLIVGSGPEEEMLRRTAQTDGQSNIHFLGFQNQQNVRRTLFASDILVLPSDFEPWGLVVNEAMACSLPVIVSDSVGASADLVLGRGTGRVFPTGNVNALASAMQHYLVDRSACAADGARALELICGWSITTSAECIASAAMTAWRRRGSSRVD